MTAAELIRAALREDLGTRGDVTTRFFVPRGTRLRARVVARKPGRLAGVEIARDVFRTLGCRARVLVRDGKPVRAGQAVLEVTGGRGLLTAERTALNFIQHLSGIATATAAFVARVKGTWATIYDTRKTLPGWRALEKYAVRCGGGNNHRRGLFDAAMVKDNHWTADIAAGARALRRRYPRLPLIIEADRFVQIPRALSLKPDVILLDNMRRAELRRSIRAIKGTPTKVEISGGVTLANVRSLAKLGPDRISIGALTHSAPALDFGLDLVAK